MRCERVLPSEKDELDKVVAYGLKPGVLTSVVAGIETNLVLMNEGLEEVAILTAGRLEANEAEAAMVSGMMRNVRASIGSTFELDEAFVAPTLWGSVSFMADEIIRVGARVADTIESFLPFKANITSRLDEAKGSSDTTLKILTMIMKTMKALTADNELVKQTISSFQENQRGRGRRGLGKEEATSMENLMAEMMVGTTNTPEGGNSPSRLRSGLEPRTATVTGEHSHHPMLTEENFRKFMEMVEDVGVLKLTAESSAIKFGSLGLQNLQECSKWASKNFPDNRYGLIIDPLILLDRIFGNDDVDPMTQLKTLESRAKLNIDTGAEASSITSLGHPRPRIFHSGRPMMTCDQNTSRLNKLGKHGVWKTGSEGVRNYIIQRMNGLQSSIASDITYAYSTLEECAMAKMVTTMSLTSSVAFITQLLNYIDSLFEKLHVHSKFTVDTAWGLTMQVLDRIVADLYTPKDGVANGMKGDRSSICASIIWSSFQTLDIAQIYVDHSFENHPAIFSEFIKFLATNSGFEKVERLYDQMELMKGKVAAAVEDVKRSAAKADTASTKCADAVRDLTALTCRVKAVEERCAR